MRGHETKELILNNGYLGQIEKYIESFYSWISTLGELKININSHSRSTLVYSHSPIFGRGKIAHIYHHCEELNWNSRKVDTWYYCSHLLYSKRQQNNLTNIIFFVKILFFQIQMESKSIKFNSPILINTTTVS